MECEGEKFSYTSRAGSSSVRTGELLPETLILASAEQKKKPRFQNAESIHFSISHSGDWWSCAVSTEEVGLDIQQERHCRAERLARRFYHPLEVAWLEKNGYKAKGVWPVDMFPFTVHVESICLLSRK